VVFETNLGLKTNVLNYIPAKPSHVAIFFKEIAWKFDTERETNEGYTNGIYISIKVPQS
jgi:hypothetical protein